MATEAKVTVLAAGHFGGTVTSHTIELPLVQSMAKINLLTVVGSGHLAETLV